MLREFGFQQWLSAWKFCLLAFGWSDAVPPNLVQRFLVRDSHLRTASPTLKVWLWTLELKVQPFFSERRSSLWLLPSFRQSYEVTRVGADRFSSGWNFSFDNSGLLVRWGLFLLSHTPRRTRYSQSLLCVLLYKPIVLVEVHQPNSIYLWLAAFWWWTWRSYIFLPLVCLLVDEILQKNFSRFKSVCRSPWI